MDLPFAESYKIKTVESLKRSTCLLYTSTYASIFVGTPIMYDLNVRKEKKLAAKTAK